MKTPTSRSLTFAVVSGWGLCFQQERGYWRVTSCCCIRRLGSFIMGLRWSCLAIFRPRRLRNSISMSRESAICTGKKWQWWRIRGSRGWVRNCLLKIPNRTSYGHKLEKKVYKKNMKWRRNLYQSAYSSTTSIKNPSKSTVNSTG